MAKQGVILVVDDVPATRAILKEAYSKEYDVEEAPNGLECLDKIYFYINDLKAVFLDVLMPQMDGFAVLEELDKKGFLGRFPIFLITTETSDKVVNRAYQYGVVDVIPKPFDLLFTKKRITNIIDLYETRRLQQKQIQKAAKQVGKQRGVYNSILETIVSCVCTRQVACENSCQNMVNASFVFLQYVAQHFQKYKIDKKDIPMIAELCGLYDIGKIAISDEILKKPGDLVEEERVAMEEHCRYGADIFKSIEEIKGTKLLRYACTICESHHERYDGAGYPNGLSGDDIAIEAQIVGILDAYIALTSPRPHRKAYNHKTAKAMILNGECGAFSPDILECFENNIDEIYKTIFE